jgi:pyridoxamine 5'-phosphate oxidase
VTDERERPLRRRDLDPDPLRQFVRWFEEARAAVRAPEAAALATASADGGPAARRVEL